MLRRLEIDGFALIERASIDFADGATIMTGETGSGKTMLLGALEFVLGARANAMAASTPGTRTRVSLGFEPDARFRAQFAQDGFDLDDDEDASILREVSANGKSSVRVNGRAASAGYVRELAERLVDAVGQHEAQRLLAPRYHAALLDRFAKCEVAREATAHAHARLIAARAALAQLQGDEIGAMARVAQAREALEEIAASAPQVGEIERLRERARMLGSAQQIAQALHIAHDALTNDEQSAVSALGAAMTALGGIASFSTSLAALAGEVAALQEQVVDVATMAARELDACEFNPGELDSLNERIDALDRLRRKYGEQIEDVFAYASVCQETIDIYATRDAQLATLRAALSGAQAELLAAAQTLTAARREAAPRLVQVVEAEFADLALPGARFDVHFEAVDPIGPDGAERSEFLFAANAGEGLQALARVASGGELSRVLLALVVALPGRREPTALVFDEIDAGIGGATASAVGTRLARLAARTQVLCVTHLAQIAVHAQVHYVLEKQESNGATRIQVRLLDRAEARRAEIARMLSGESHTVALEHARSLIAAAERPEAAQASSG